MFSLSAGALTFSHVGKFQVNLITWLQTLNLQWNTVKSCSHYNEWTHLRLKTDKSEKHLETSLLYSMCMHSYVMQRVT